MYKCSFYTVKFLRIMWLINRRFKKVAWNYRFSIILISIRWINSRITSRATVFGIGVKLSKWVRSWFTRIASLRGESEIKANLYAIAERPSRKSRHFCAVDSPWKRRKKGNAFSRATLCNCAVSARQGGNLRGVDTLITYREVSFRPVFFVKLCNSCCGLWLSLSAVEREINREANKIFPQT